MHCHLNCMCETLKFTYLIVAQARQNIFPRQFRYSVWLALITHVQTVWFKTHYLVLQSIAVPFENSVTRILRKFAYSA